jgi:hypothetical protein
MGAVKPFDYARVPEIADRLKVGSGMYPADHERLSLVD